MNDENENKGGEGGELGNQENAGDENKAGDIQESHADRQAREAREAAEREGSGGDTLSTREGDTAGGGKPATEAGTEGAGAAGADEPKEVGQVVTLDAQQTKRIQELGHTQNGEVFWVIDGRNHRCKVLEIKEVDGKPQATLQVLELV